MLLTILQRPIPKELIEYWETLSFDVDIETNYSFDPLSINVSSGVNTELIAQNLRALKHIVVRFSQKKPAWDTTIECDKDFWILANIVLAWFWAMGISARTVQNWLKLDDVDVSDVLNGYQQDHNIDVAKLATILPFPRVIDVHVQQPMGFVRLMQDSPEDHDHTIRVCC